MPDPFLSESDFPESRCLAIVMGGGAGTRLFPLTQDRSKPAVPLAGKYRLVDIPISNCINSGIRQAYVLTQYNSHSLNRHISRAYQFDRFSRSRGFVEILAAQQTMESGNWFQGTADAVRQNLRYFMEVFRMDYFLILSGDQLYRMDFRRVLNDHIARGADVTIATIPVKASDTEGFGIMKTDPTGRITDFIEKPKTPEAREPYKAPETMRRALLEAREGKPPRKGELPLHDGMDFYLASMGIYLFNKKALVDCLAGDSEDFGKHIIPQAIQDLHVSSFIFDEYWEDIGTIRSFYEANLDICSREPCFNVYDDSHPIFTNARQLPASKVNGATVSNALLSDGCIISDATISQSIIGVRCRIESGTVITRSIVMGSDFYEFEVTDATNSSIPLGIGKGCFIEDAIVDKNVRIGDNVRITSKTDAPNADHKHYYIRDGLVIIPKGMVIPDGTVI